MIIFKITLSVHYNSGLKHLDTQLNEPTNQNLTNKKTLQNFNSPIPPTSLHTIPSNKKAALLQKYKFYLARWAGEEVVAQGQNSPWAEKSLPTAVLIQLSLNNKYFISISLTIMFEMNDFYFTFDFQPFERGNCFCIFCKVMIIWAWLITVWLIRAFD